ncbi:MAG: SET domain-containing protein [Nannocystaceae bacterium]
MTRPRRWRNSLNAPQVYVGSFTDARRLCTITGAAILGDPDSDSMRTTLYVYESVRHGKGVFAKREIQSGEFLGEYKGPAAKRNGSHVLWADDEHGRSGRNLLRYLNHSRRPNAEFDGFLLYAKRRIRCDEEVTFNYGDPSFDFY